ncbi:MAG: ABC-2 type transport system permease protein [Myxococcota bacterium]|jgi:ABC-2 type transport system permease protein
MRLSRAGAIALKEIMHILRDPQVLIFALGMPVVLILLFGYAVSFDVEKVPLLIVDQDQTAASRELTTAFTASKLFVTVAESDDPAAADPAFRRGVATLALVIPPGFERALARGDEAVAQLLLDGTDNMTAAIALGYANAISLSVTQRRLAASFGEASLPVTARVRTLFNPRLLSSVMLVPGLMVLILVMVAVMLTALTVAREYERGSMEQLFATPVTRLEIILGKLAPYFVLGQLQVLLVLTLGVVLFGVPIAGSLLLLFGVASVFLLAMLMQGLVISILVPNQMVASQLAVITTMLPALLLSGFVFPISNMPPVLQAVSSALPATYLVHALRAILLRGNGLDAVAGDVGAMAIFFAVMLLISLKRFKRWIA